MLVFYKNFRTFYLYFVGRRGSVDLSFSKPKQMTLYVYFSSYVRYVIVSVTSPVGLRPRSRFVRVVAADER